jgi:sugar-specific transcriptional regulator TrmB
MREQLEKELEKIGLSEKEAKVYLAALELGPSTAQSIAAKATVNRPTTYIMIETLIKRGLMSSFEKGKKRIFAASKPNQLLYVLENQKKEILEKEIIVKSLMPAQVDILQGVQEPIVKVYEGMAGLRLIQEDILNTVTDEVLELTSLDEARKFIPPIFEGDIREKLVSMHKTKSLFVSKLGLSEKQYGRIKNVEFRELKDPSFPILGEMIVYGDKTNFTSYTENPSHIVISDKNIATTCRSLFMSLWEKGKPIKF